MRNVVIRVIHAMLGRSNPQRLRRDIGDARPGPINQLDWIPT